MNFSAVSGGNVHDHAVCIEARGGFDDRLLGALLKAKGGIGRAGRGDLEIAIFATRQTIRNIAKLRAKGEHSAFTAGAGQV